MNILLFVRDGKLYKITANIVVIMAIVEKNSAAWETYHVYTSAGIWVNSSDCYPILYGED